MNERPENKKLKACVITGTRAEYGLLYWTLKELELRPDFDLHLVVTGTHTSKNHGSTITEIEADGFKIDDIIEVQIDGDSRAATAKTAGIAMMGFADYFRRTSPDFVMVLGDRYESFAAATSSFLMGIPIVHLCGGDVSRGAFDDSLRHAISKFASLHCVTRESHRRRLIQLGEESWRIENVGNISAESILKMDWMTYKEVTQMLGVQAAHDYILCTYHPTTARSANELDDGVVVENLIESLLCVTSSVLVFTGTNSDPAGRKIAAIIEGWVKRFPSRILVFQNLGRVRYLSAMRYASAVVGNSSSGVLEAPILGVRTINIGSRQEGRSFASTVCNSSGEKDDVKRTALECLSDGCSGKNKRSNTRVNHCTYSSQSIVEFLSRSRATFKTRKSFVDLGGNIL